MPLLGVLKTDLTQPDTSCLSFLTLFSRSSCSPTPPYRRLNFFPFTLFSSGAPGSGAIKFSPPKGDCLVEKRPPLLHDGSGAPQAFLLPQGVQLQHDDQPRGFPPSRLPELLQPSWRPSPGLKRRSSCRPFALYLPSLQPGSSNPRPCRKRYRLVCGAVRFRRP